MLIFIGIIVIVGLVVYFYIMPNFKWLKCKPDDKYELIFHHHTEMRIHVSYKNLRTNMIYQLKEPGDYPVSFYSKYDANTWKEKMAKLGDTVGALHSRYEVNLAELNKD